MASVLTRTARLLDSVTHLCERGFIDQGLILARSLYEVAVSVYLDWLAPEKLGPHFILHSQLNRDEDLLKKVREAVYLDHAASLRLLTPEVVLLVGKKFILDRKFRADQVDVEHLLWAAVDAGLVIISERNDRRRDWEPYQWRLTDAGEALVGSKEEPIDVAGYLAQADDPNHPVLAAIRMRGLDRGTIALYVGGFADRAERKMLDRFVASGIRQVDHWSDLDVGGLRILRQIQTLVPIEVRPYRMKTQLLDRLPT